MAPQTPIKIGYLTTRTGVAAAGGIDMEKAIHAFFETTGFQIAGRKVELIVEDDRHNGTRAIGLIRDMVENRGVHLLCGTISANLAYAVAPVVDMLRVPMVLPITGADDLTKRKRYKWIIRTGFSSSQYGLPFGEWVYNKLQYRRVAALGLDYAFGWELVGSFQKTFEALGGTVEQRIWIPQGASNVVARVKEIRSDLDAVFFATSNQGADIVATQYQQHGPKLPIVGGGPGFDETVLRDVGDVLLGAVSVANHSGELETPANLRFKKLLRTKFGDTVPASMYSEGGYTAGMWIKRAIESLDGNVEDPGRLLEALQQVDLADAPRGPMRMDTYGNPIQNIYIRKVEKAGNRVQNTVIDTIRNVSQFWRYNPDKFMAEPSFARDAQPGAKV